MKSNRYKAQNALSKTAAILALAVIFLSGYWLKCQMDVGFSPAVSLSGHFPFKYLQRNKVISSPGPGILLQDSFDSSRLFGNWTGLWMREPGTVEKYVSRGGIDGSHCFVITSRSPKSWSCSHNKFVEVGSGDRFSFEVWVKLHGNKPASYAGVSAFDGNRNTVSWNFVSDKTSQTGAWVKLEKTFTVPEGIKYIKFKLSGSGEYRFDNILFEKLN
jgi:hypothetical protein